MNPTEPLKKDIVEFEGPSVPLATPGYLPKIYWWAYEHPLAVRFWDHGLLINLILLGNYDRLVDAVLEEFPSPMTGSTLQISCAYGKLTPRLQTHLGKDGTLDVIDVLNVQLENVRRKLRRPDDRIRLIQCDATDLHCPEALAEAFRVVKPGGQIVLVEFHNPNWWHPLKWYQRLVFLLFEPFAMDMWRHELADYFPKGANYSVTNMKSYFGGLYQKLVIVKK